MCSDSGEQKARERLTQPRTLSGIPRVDGVAPETPAEDVRNALAILFTCQQANNLMGNDGPYVVLAQSDYVAIKSRLSLAVSKLERNV